MTIVTRPVNERIKYNLKKRVKDYLKKKRIKLKELPIDTYLGCNIREFMAYLEKQFKPGMEWANYGQGKGKWNIDHIIPLKDATCLYDYLKLNHYTNMRPMWYEENHKKN